MPWEPYSSSFEKDENHMRIVSSLEVSNRHVAPSTLDRVSDRLMMAVEVNRSKMNNPLEFCDDQEMAERITSQVNIASDDILGNGLDG